MRCPGITCAVMNYLHGSGIWNFEFGIIFFAGFITSIILRRSTMRYSRFEDLPAWNSAIDLAVHTYELTSKPEFDSRYSLRDQLERAAVSVSNNVAEGFERGTNKELLSFLYISRGSAGEVRSMLCLLDRIPTFQRLSTETTLLKKKA